MKIHAETRVIENWLYKNTGLEFTFSTSSRVNGIQLTNQTQYDKFLTKHKKELGK
jgi:hypothetical protein